MPNTSPRTVPASARLGPGRKVLARGDTVASFRMRITAGDTIAIGPGKIALLEAVAQTGSLTAAAKSLGMSYRRAWMLLDEVNRSLKNPAVASAKGGSHGGGSELTNAGRQLIELYRRIESTAMQACASDIRKIFGLLAR